MNYPFYERSRDQLKLRGGRPLSELTLEAVCAGRIGPQEVGIDAGALRAQARVAEVAGFRQLAANLRRAAELVGVPDETILETYDALRPGRSTPERLEERARELEDVYGAPLTARFLREAAAALGENRKGVT